MGFGIGEDPSGVGRLFQNIDAAAAVKSRENTGVSYQNMDRLSKLDRICTSIKAAFGFGYILPGSTHGLFVPKESYEKFKNDNKKILEHLKIEKEQGLTIENFKKLLDLEQVVKVGMRSVSSIYPIFKGESVDQLTFNNIKYILNICGAEHGALDRFGKYFIEDFKKGVVYDNINRGILPSASRKEFAADLLNAISKRKMPDELQEVVTMLEKEITKKTPGELFHKTVPTTASEKKKPSLALFGNFSVSESDQTTKVALSTITPQYPTIHDLFGKIPLGEVPKLHLSKMSPDDKKTIIENVMHFAEAMSKNNLSENTIKEISPEDCKEMFKRMGFVDDIGKTWSPFKNNKLGPLGAGLSVGSQKLEIKQAVGFMEALFGRANS